MLIVFSGLPGTGKTTLANELARRAGALYVRIDSIEQALRNAAVLAGDVGASGYTVANRLALDNLRLGAMVVADGVNPVAESRNGWRTVAQAAGVPLFNIEVVCSDAAEHQRRVETRVADLPGLQVPTWHSVQRHEYEAWTTRRFLIDTAVLSPLEAVDLIIKALPN